MTPLLRLRTDEQLVALFRRGSEEAFRVIHDRYHDRLLAYARQMLPGSAHDAEDALQEVFVRAYRGLRASDRPLALRPWLYRVAHNRCIDHLRRRHLTAAGPTDLRLALVTDPCDRAEQKESLARLVDDIRRLPEQQRSALLMRELAGMSYDELGEALGVSVPAIKSLLVRARVGLVRAAEARDASCTHIQEELVLAHDRRVRPNSLARRHVRECHACSAFRNEIRGTSRQVAALVPGAGLLGAFAKLLGTGGSSGAAAGGGAVAAGGALGGSCVTTLGFCGAGAGHLAGLVAAAVVTAGGAVATIQTTSPPSPPAIHHVVKHLATSSRGAGTGNDAPLALAAAVPKQTAGVVARDVSLISPAAARATTTPPAAKLTAPATRPSVAAKPGPATKPTPTPATPTTAPSNSKLTSATTAVTDSLSAGQGASSPPAGTPPATGGSTGSDSTTSSGSSDGTASQSSAQSSQSASSPGSTPSPSSGSAGSPGAGGTSSGSSPSSPSGSGSSSPSASTASAGSGSSSGSSSSGSSSGSSSSPPPPS